VDNLNHPEEHEEGNFISSGNGGKNGKTPRKCGAYFHDFAASFA
jgi:hypothetical protein